MFDSLEEQMKKDEDKATSGKERMMRWALYGLAGVLVCGGVIVSLHFLG